MLALAACSATGAFAQAGNAANGATLYAMRINVSGAQASCQDCHGFAGTFRDSRFPGATEATIRAGIQAAINSNDGMVMGAYSVWTRAADLRRRGSSSGSNNAAAPAAVCSTAHAGRIADFGDVRHDSRWQHEPDGHGSSYQ